MSEFCYKECCARLATSALATLTRHVGNGVLGEEATSWPRFRKGQGVYSILALGGGSAAQAALSHWPGGWGGRLKATKLQTASPGSWWKSRSPKLEGAWQAAQAGP